MTYRFKNYLMEDFGMNLLLDALDLNLDKLV